MRSPRLSIHAYGKEYKAIDLKLCKQGVPVINEDELNFVFDLVPLSYLVCRGLGYSWPSGLVSLAPWSAQEWPPGRVTS